MKVVFTRAGERSFLRLPADRRRQILERIKAVAANPTGRSQHVEPLAGSDLFRLRVGDYRVLLSMDQAQDLLTVELVRTRGRHIQEVAMSFALPQPKTVTDDEVVLSREDWDAIVRILGEPTPDFDEDEDDIAAVSAARDEDRRLAAHLEAERGSGPETVIPIEVLQAKLDGAHPIKAWRDHRGWTQMHLSAKSDGVGRDLIAQMETRRKKGSIETLGRLARALEIPMEALIEDPNL
jgi:mRNA-degrading endonuclease RelE of RelBE toxin-antitoxin system